ncbi:MAG: hypothetical protein KDA24_19315 [Deltaproteobacteria bacterium]|nr:hypothetical protein [Deltaproteobacteria bacterium]
MSRSAFFAALLTSLALPGAAAAQCALHDHSGSGTRPMAQDQREIDRGDATEDLIDVAKRQKKSSVQVYFDALRGVEWAVGEAYRIESKTLDLAYGQVTLSGGWVIPMKPKDVPEAILKDKPEGWLPEHDYIIAVYVGDGSFQYEAPNPTERWALNDAFKQLKIDRKSDRDAIEVTVDGGAVIHLNGRWRELLEEGAVKGEADNKTLKSAKQMFNARADLSGIDYARKQTRDAFEGKERGFLGLELASKTYKAIPYLSYSYDPDEHEAVEIGVAKRYALNRDVVNFRTMGAWVDPVVAEGKTDGELGRMATVWEVDASHYTQDMTVFRDPDYNEWGMRVQGSADFTFNESRKTLRLAMMNWGETGSDRRVTVEWIKDGAGNNLEFLHHGFELIVKLPKEYAKGDTLKLQYKFAGLFVDTIKQPKADGGLDQNATNTVDIINYRVPNDYPWYPQVPGHVDSYSFDWTLRTPKPMLAATSGMLMSLTDDGKHNVHVIKEDVPVSFPAILFGRFAMRENQPDFSKGEIKIRVFVHPGYEKDIDSFIEEAQSIINYYSAVFGPYPYKELDLAQMPGFFGYAQAPAGLVQMTGEVYLSKTDLVNVYNRPATLRDYFIPHEIGHEWWGHRAGWGSYRDQWVSETMAEYSAALYIEERDRRKSGDPNDTSGYDDRSIEWKRQRKGHVQDRTSPLWMGGRGPHYQSSVYARGPLVMDQLRKAFGREAVLKVMYLYNNWAHDHGGHAITDEFLLILEKALPGVGFQDFIDNFIKLNEALPE